MEIPVHRGFFLTSNLIMSETTEVIKELLESVYVDGNYRNTSLELLEKGQSRYVLDLKLNFNSNLT